LELIRDIHKGVFPLSVRATTTLTPKWLAAYVCIETEKSPIAKVSHHRLHECFSDIDETIANTNLNTPNKTTTMFLMRG
jgi:phosphatidate phosphatase APP1